MIATVVFNRWFLPDKRQQRDKFVAFPTISGGATTEYLLI
jgi:hypothetical protein